MHFCTVHDILYIVHSFFESRTSQEEVVNVPALERTKTHIAARKCWTSYVLLYDLNINIHKLCLPLQLHPASSWVELSELLIMLIPGNSGALPCWFSGAWRFDGGKKGCLLSQKDAAASHFDVFSTTEQLFFQVKNSGNFTFGPNSLCF